MEWRSGDSYIGAYSAGFGSVDEEQGQELCRWVRIKEDLLTSPVK